MGQRRRKESNRFKFISFSERINSINVDVFHRLSHQYEEIEEGKETYLQQALDKWTVLNRTKEWLEFRKELSDYGIRTLPLLLNQSKAIADTFIKHLPIQNEHSLQPVLELLTAFVKDVRHEFYMHYSTILSVLMKILQSRDPAVIEQTFVCLAHIFKYIVKNLVKDLDTVLVELAPLLDDNCPEYVREFAAQSFSFVARRVKDKEKLLNLVMSTAQKHNQLISGCGKLLAETMFGIRGQLHSSADEMSRTLIQAFGDPSYPQNLLLEVGSQIVQSYAEKVDPKHSTFFTILTDVIQQKLEMDDAKLKNIGGLLSLATQALGYRSGIHLRGPSEFVSALLNLMASDVCPKTVHNLVAHLASLLLTSKNTKLPQQSAAKLIAMMLKAPKEVLTTFLEHVYEYSGFEALILPRVLELCTTNDNAVDVEIIAFLSKVVLKKSKIGSAWSRYPLDFTLKNQSFPEKLLTFLETSCDFSGENARCLANCLILLPHVTPLNTGNTTKMLSELIKKICSSIRQNQEQENTIVTLYFALKGSVHLKGGSNLDINDIYETLVPIMQNNLVAIYCLELLLQIAIKAKAPSSSVISENDCGQCLPSYASLRQYAINILTSPYHRTRCIALQILINLEKLCEEIEESRLLTVLETCLTTENVALTTQDYRNAIIHLEELHLAKTNLSKDQLQIPLRFLLGYMFSNFSLIEKPVQEALHSYTTEASSKIHFQQQLGLQELMENTYALIKTDEPCFINDAILEEISSNDRPDLSLYKHHLWQIFANNDSPHVLENEIIDMAVESISLQMRHLSEEYVPTCDIRQHRAEISNVEEEKEENETDRTVRFSKMLVCDQLAVLKKSGKSLQIDSLCMKLLLSLNSEIRRHALDCIINQRQSFFSTYRPHLMNLVHDDGFQNALVHFQVDKDSGTLNDSHRPEIMPVVLRLLYSKMVGSGPTHRGNKASAAALRRSQVTRFLAGCNPNEIEEFLRMSFFHFKVASSESNSFRLIVEEMSEVKLEAVISPRKLQSSMHLVLIMLEHLGGHLSVNLQTFVLQVIVHIAATTYSCFSSSEASSIYAGNLTVLKKVRNLCLDSLINFFQKFTNYPWSEDIVEAIFKVCIWPSVDRLQIESLQSPSSLLKLCAVWSENPRYFPLLSRFRNGVESDTPLAAIINLLLHKQCQQTVTVTITTILENMLTLQDECAMETDDEPSLPLEIQYIRPVDEEELNALKGKSSFNYGSKLLVPHISEILEHLRRQLSRKERKGLSRTDSNVLSRVSELATSPSHGDSLLGILLRILISHPPSDEEVLINTINTVRHLFGIVSRPQLYVRSLAQLFGIIELTQARKLLLVCLEDLAKRSDDLLDISNAVRELNAYDRRWIDQCDFNKRLDTLKRIRILTANGEISVNMGLFVIHNGFFFLRCEKDLSLRDSTEMCLKEMTPVLLRKVHENINDREHLTETLLKLIRTAIRSKDDRYKGSAISFLGILARESSESHFVLKDLSILTSQIDMEVDFFENIHHLQVYRRMRALQRFSTLAKSFTKAPSNRTLTQFLLPLASQFMCSETYANKNTLIDSAIEYIGIICRLLPWYQYQAILKHYLQILRTKVEYQRQCVRLITTILDAFHFDLSLAKRDEKQADLSESDERIGDADNVPQLKEDPAEDANEAPAEEKIDLDIENDVEKALDDELDNLPDDKEASESAVEEVVIPHVERLVLEMIVTLKPSAAARVQKALSGHLLDQLYKAIGQRTTLEMSHKVNKKSLGPDKDEEDIVRVPIAITLVKLLQKLPGDCLEVQLPGIITKLCTFLKSHLESVRRVTRDTLKEIIVILGPDKLALILGELTELLTKGFQVHVLAYTVHSVVQAVQPQLRLGDLDRNLPTILQVCNANLFGLQSEEREVFRIQVKHKEARSNKSFNLLNLVAQLITEKCLTDLILPIKTELFKSPSHKTQTKCRECLRQIVLGVALNQFIVPENLLKFVYGVTSESIPLLKPEAPPVHSKPNPRVKQDCFVIAPEPRSRSVSAPVKNNSRTGAHIIMEFGLHLLTVLLKQDKTKILDLRPYLDPMVPELKAAIDSQNVKVSTLAIKSLSRMLKFDLPSLKEHIKTITAMLFTILHKFGAAGLSKGDNFDLVLATFKMMSIIVRDVEYHLLTEDQLRILLLYAEQDIHDNTRQAVAFGLLKSVLHRRLKTPELHSVMLKVANLSITSEHNHVRIQARQTVHQYMMDYPLGKKQDEMLAFFIAQLNYELECGRQSALEMIFSLINSYPFGTLKKNAGLLYLSLGAMLINDDSVDCKKMVASVIKELLVKLDLKGRNELFEMIVTWSNQKKLTHRQLANQLAGIFVNLEKDDFSKRLDSILDVIIKQLVGSSTSGRFVSLHKASLTEDENLKDLNMFQVMNLLVKICSDCSTFLTDKKYYNKVNQLTGIAQSLLSHPHEWVRCGAAQFLGSVFTTLKPNILSLALRGESTDAYFWDAESLPALMKSLILDHTSQLVPGVELSQQFVDQLVKNLVFFGKVLKGARKSVGVRQRENDSEQDANINKQPISLLWLIKRMRRIVNMEVSQKPGSYVLRTAVFLWTGALAVCLSKEEMSDVVYNLAAPLIRETEVAQGETTKSPIADLVLEVTNKLKKKVGVDAFSEHALKVQARLMEKRSERKSKQARQFIIDPEKAVQRKMQKQRKKKEMKKISKEIIRGKMKKKNRTIRRKLKQTS